MNRDDIDPGKPQDHAFVASFTGRLREERLNEGVFPNLSGAKRIVGLMGGYDYNTIHRQRALENKTPKEVRQWFAIYAHARRACLGKLWRSINVLCLLKTGSF